MVNTITYAVAKTPKKTIKVDHIKQSLAKEWGMFAPPHPGDILREDILPALGLSVTGAAKQLGVSRSALTRVLSGRGAISVEMALRIEAWLGVENGGRASAWVAQQIEHDLWNLRQRIGSKLANVRRAMPKTI